MAPEEQQHLSSMSGLHRCPDAHMNRYLVGRGKKLGSNNGNFANTLITCYMVPGHKGGSVINFGKQEESKDKTNVRFLGKGVKQRNHNGAGANVGGKAEGSLVTALA